MQSVKGGKFCQSCSKKVIDLRKLSDKEILKHITTASEGFCGHLSAHQVDRTYQQLDNTPTLFSKIAASFLFVWMAQHASASTSPKSIITGTRIHLSPTKERFKEKGTLIEDRTVPIKGQIIDSKTQETIPGATVLIKNTEHATATDINGFFKLDVPGDDLRSVVITISAIGYITQELTVDPTKPIAYNVLLVPDSTALTNFGFVGLITYKPKWWQIGKKLKYKRSQKRHEAEAKNNHE